MTQHCRISDVYFGKVRDSVVLNDGRRIIRTSDRISAFDMMMPFRVIGKGPCLQRLSLAAFAATDDILPNHVIGVLDDRTILVRNLRILPIEFIVRRFVTGSLWRMVRSPDGFAAVDKAYGVNMSAALGGQTCVEHARLASPILTPTYKAVDGHDLPLHVRDLVPTIERFLQSVPGARSQSVLQFVESLNETLVRLFLRGEECAAKRGLILVDTKYELGLTENGELVLADEAHTPDSSRYWTELPKAGQVRQLSKEFLREELMRAEIVEHDELTRDGSERLRALGPTLAERIAAQYGELEERFLGPRNDRVGEGSFPKAEWPIDPDEFEEATAPARKVERLLLVGNGGRDYAILSRFSSLPGILSTACVPGDRAWRSRQVPVANWPSRPMDAVVNAAVAESIDLIVVGPELPIAQGIKAFAKKAGVSCLAPGLMGAALEASKLICKEALVGAGIPTADAQTKSLSEIRVLKDPPFLPCVLKFDGLASGKGVYMIASKSDWLEAKASIEEQADEWMSTVRSMTCPSASARAGEPMFLIEESLAGEEYSLFALCNGTNYRLLPVARDYKRRNDGQQGPNTGGMGAVAPVAIPQALLLQFKDAFERILKYQVEQGEPYRGFLFGGFMVDAKGNSKVLEFNCRLGDPETQVVLPGLGDEFLLECFRTAADQDFYWPERTGAFFTHDGLARVYVVGAAPEYPATSAPYRKLRRRDREDTLTANPICALNPSTIEADGRTKGGRAFGVLAKGKTLADARQAAYAELADYLLDDLSPHYRRDIAAEFY
jgi:phosphoribosylaminoimidazole-succinocarboxamide synthase